MNTNELKKQKETERKKEKKNVKIFPMENIIFSVGIKIRLNFPANPIVTTFLIF